jgi:hypothetical protein
MICTHSKRVVFEGKIDDLDGQTIRKDPHGPGWSVAALDSCPHGSHEHLGLTFGREFGEGLREIGLKAGVGQRLRVTVEVLP